MTIPLQLSGLHIEQFVPGDPIGQPRLRPMQRGKHLSVFMPETAAPWRDIVIYCMKRHRPAQPWDGPISIDLEFYFLRPQSHVDARGRLKPNAPRLCVSEYDNDNLEKSTWDAIGQCGIWTDDKRIADNHTRKYYVLPGEQAGAMIIIRSMDNES